MQMTVSKCALSLIALIGFIVPAAAETSLDYNCHYLWVARNDIYKEHGYCFKTPRAIAYFGNEGCPYEHEDAVPLSSDQQRQVQEIIRLETEKGCRS